MIGKTGRDISEEEALDYVLGYTASNDVSARTLQMITTQWSMSKGLDSSCPIGEPKTWLESFGTQVVPFPDHADMFRSGPCVDISDPGSSDIGN